MKSLKIAMSFVAASFLLTACGGGGDARSPDRPGLSLDPSTLEIRFINDDNTLVGTGNSRISVRMLALRSDGQNKNVGPALVVTEKTQWSLRAADLGSPAAATLAADFRDITGIQGKVKDILSSRRLSVDDQPIPTIITGVYQHQGKSYTLTANYDIIPPKPLGNPFISGPQTIVLNPLDASDTVIGNYSFLQALQNTSTNENLTHKVRFCESSEFLTPEDQSNPQTDGSVAITFSNPFADGSRSSLGVEIYAVDFDKSCDDTTATRYGPLPINLVAGTIKDVTACVITNPADDTCSAEGNLNPAYVANCAGLNSDEVAIPAGQNLQMAARLTYTNPRDANQPPLDLYKCSAENRLAWSSAPQQMFTSAPDAAAGNGSTADRVTFESLTEAERSSDVTASFTADPENGADAQVITDSLRLKLVGAEVAEIRIARKDGEAGPDKIFLNLFREGIEYQAQCRFTEFGQNSTDFVPCPESLTSWSVDGDNILEVNPADGSETEVRPTANPTGPGSLTVTATYSGGLTPISATRPVEAVEDQLVELRLFMQQHGNEADSLAIDDFACVGRQDLVGTLSEGSVIRGGQQFKAYALFSSSGETATPDAWLQDPNSADSKLVDVTDRQELRFSAVSGYWEGSCASGLAASPLPGELTGQIPAEAPVGGAPAAGFSEQTKGYLQSKGLLRLSTVCVQAFVDPELDGFTEGDLLSKDGSTVLVLPAADDNLLTYSNELCETLEPVLTLGQGFPGLEDSAGLVLPLVYTVSLIADPVLTQLATNDDGGTLPVEGILEGLETGDFTALGGPDAGAGLGTLTNALIEGVDAFPGVGIIVDVADACLADPLTSALGTILDGILSLNPGAFGELGNINTEDCEGLLGGLAP